MRSGPNAVHIVPPPGSRTLGLQAIELARALSKKHDIKQFRQACREVGLTARERYEASEALHAEKASGGVREHMGYGELVAWLRQWRGRWPVS